MNIQLPLAQRDLYLIQIEAEIKHKKNLLVKKLSNSKSIDATLAH